MPIPIMVDADRQEVALQLERLAGLVRKVTATPSPQNPHGELAAIHDHLRRIGDLLEQGTAAGGVTPAQIQSMAAGFESVAAELRKGAR